MSEFIGEDGVVHKVTHIMADGTIRDSMKGVVVPYNKHTAVSYHILDMLMQRLLEKQMDEAEQTPLPTKISG